ncbi:MAG: CHRD domain-containing protein [Burkholderiales bacterium]
MNIKPISLGIAALLLAAGAGLAWANDLKLSGAQEVPPVTTSASGTGSITVAPDGAVSGSVKTTDLAGTMAHIHLAAMGKNGPVIIPLTKAGDGVWSVPAGAKLSVEQMKSYEAGDLYVNVHSDAHKGGEVRAQMKP